MVTDYPVLNLYPPLQKVGFYAAKNMKKSRLKTAVSVWFLIKKLGIFFLSFCDVFV